MIEKRFQTDLREVVQRYLANGWRLTARDPLTLTRGRSGVTLRNGCLVSA